MKRSVFFAVFCLCSAIQMRADDVKTPAPVIVKPETPRAKAETIQRSEIKKPVKPEKLVTYSGFLVDVARTNRPGKLLNLRQPRDPVHDSENLRFDQRSGRATGFRLFSMDF